MVNVVVLATNGGPHPADKWAAVTAFKIADLIQIVPGADSEAVNAAIYAKPRFQAAVAAALESFFVGVKDDENAKIESGQIKAREDPYEIDSRVGDAIAAVVAAAVGTPFEDHFKKVAAQEAVRIHLKTFFIDAAHIERSWAFDAKGK